MKTFLKIAGVIILFILLIQMCSDGDATSTYETSSSTVGSAMDSFKNKHGLSAESMRGLLKDDKGYLSQIVGNFDYNVDEFSGLGWYTHKKEPKNRKDQTGLLAMVNEEGEFKLSSNYHGEEWLFHESVTVKIDDRVIDSSVIPFSDANNVKDNKDGEVWETVTYTSESDKNILFAIGSNPEKEIKVRFNGKDKTKTVSLSKVEKEVFADYSFLAQLLASINKKEAALNSL